MYIFFSSREKAVQRGRGRVSGGPEAVRRSPETKTERVKQRTAGEIRQHVAQLMTGGCLVCVTLRQSSLSPSADSGSSQ